MVFYVQNVLHRKERRNMERQRQMTKQERMRRREQIRRKKKRLLIRKIRRMFNLILLFVLLGGAVWFAYSNFLKKPDYGMEKPMQRSESEVKEKLEEMAKKYKGFKEIIERRLPIIRRCWIM